MIKTNIPMNEYRESIGLSKHELDNFAIAPAYYQFRKGAEFKPSRSMELGTCIHSLALEGKKDYAVAPDCDRRTKVGKEEWQAFCEEHINQIIVTSDEQAIIEGCANAVAPLMCKFDVQPEYIEASMYWERDGIRCKGRPDVIGKDRGDVILLDLKTTTEIVHFDSKFFKFRYDVQAAWYQRGLRVAMGLDYDPEFWFLVVDTQAPHLCQLVKPAHDILANAQSRIDSELAYFKRCLQTKTWPGLPESRLILSSSWNG